MSAEKGRWSPRWSRIFSEKSLRFWNRGFAIVVLGLSIIGLVVLFKVEPDLQRLRAGVSNDRPASRTTMTYLIDAFESGSEGGYRMFRLFAVVASISLILDLGVSFRSPVNAATGEVSGAPLLSR